MKTSGKIILIVIGVAIIFIVVYCINYFIGKNAKVTISQVLPSSAAVGDTFIITGSGFSPHGNFIFFDGLVEARDVDSDGHTLQDAVGKILAPNCRSGTPCPMYLLETTPRTYTVTVQNKYGVVSNPIQFTVI